MVLTGHITPLKNTNLSKDGSGPTALEFEEFSFRDADGDLTGGDISKAHHDAFLSYLAEHYGATDVWELMPFLILGCEEEPPPEDARPFTIAGAIAIWRKDDDMGFWAGVGDFGQSDPIEIDSSIIEMMDGHQIPPREVILYLANNVFPESEAFSVIWDSLVVELPEVDEETHHSRLQKLPFLIAYCVFTLRYHNGPLPDSETRKRFIRPSLRVLHEAIANETDYVKEDGKFSPGAMIGSVGDDGEVASTVAAGILVEKKGQKRLTCPFQNWNEHYKTRPDWFGKADDDAKKTFNFVQGDPGTSVGFVRERLGWSDIALAQLHDDVVFENRFMEVDATPKRFLASHEQRKGDLYIMDTFLTGKQYLVGSGRRFSIARPDVAYICREQGAFTTSSPNIFTKAFIRDSACGAVVMRCKLASQKIGGLVDPATLRLNKVGGMMHFADLESRYNLEARQYYIFADAPDPLVEAGWTIVEDEISQAGTGDEPEEESPSKKRRLANRKE